MKKLISFLVVLTLVVGMSVPAFAATPAKYADCTTNAQRIQYFKDTYGFTYITPDKGTATTKVLDTVVSGFSLVGTSTCKTLLKPFDKTLNFTIWSSAEWSFESASFGGNSRGEADFMVVETATKKNVVHEMMHAFNDGILSGSGSSEFLSLNGSYSGYTTAKQYVSSYASTNAMEDFAETCAAMIVNGGGTPCTVGKDTILYKKYKACYDLMVEHLGTKSNATIRSAAFLGIELPKE